MKTPLRIACIGCGFMGRLHLEVIRKRSDCIIAAVADINPATAAAVATQFKANRWTTRAEDLLHADDIDAVILALTPDVRLPLTLRALENGKHVLVEKPAALTPADLEKMIACQPPGVVAAACSSRLSLYRSAAATRAALAKNAVGPIRLIRFRRIQPINATSPWAKPPDWRLSRALNGGGLLINWGSYDFDLLFSLFQWNLNPVEVSAHTLRPGAWATDHFAPDSDGETHIAALIRFEDGSVLDYERAEFHLGPFESCRQICGEKATLLMSEQDPGGTVQLLTRQIGREPETHTLYNDPQPKENMHDPGPTADFIDAILTNRPPATDLRQSLKIARLIEAIYHSAITGTSNHLTRPANDPQPQPTPPLVGLNPRRPPQPPPRHAPQPRSHPHPTRLGLGSTAPCPIHPHRSPERGA